MRHLIFILLFTLPLYAGASVTMSQPPTETTSTSSALSIERTDHKQGFLKHFMQKTIQKRAVKSLIRYRSDNGRGLCIAGFVIGLVVLVGAPVFIGLIYYYGIGFFILALLLSLTGLSMSIIGLIKARGWQGTRTIRILAIIGIVLNALIALPCLLLLRVIIPQGV